MQGRVCFQKGINANWFLRVFVAVFLTAFLFSQSRFWRLLYYKIKLKQRYLETQVIQKIILYHQSL